MRVTVVYALPDALWERSVELAPGATLGDAVTHSGVLDAFPALRQTELSVGIYGKLCPLHERVCDGDRVEIYRPLRVDPKEARRIRAEMRRRTAVRTTGS